MSDASVAAALRSHHRLVVVEAPAGCGKTWQGAEFAATAAAGLVEGRVLILTHTNAACGVFAKRMPTLRDRTDIRTIDSIILSIAGAYHRVLDLPDDPGRWARSRSDGYDKLAEKVAGLLRRAPSISRMLARRYPIVICDEHQDASLDQHAIAMSFGDAGASLRIFGDPMQRIYGSPKAIDIERDEARWKALQQQAGISDALDEPHRWRESAPLGQWILQARTILRDGGRIDLTTALPEGLTIVVAENTSPNARKYIVSKDDRKPIDSAVDSAEELLVLSTRRDIVDSLRAFFNRRLPIWEGHVREALSTLSAGVKDHTGNGPALAPLVVTFLEDICTGFTRSGYGQIFLDEVAGGCQGKRNGKPAALQSLARLLIAQPDHRGVAEVLRTLKHLVATNPAFANIKIDYPREYGDTIALGRFSDPDDGFSELARRRAQRYSMPPAKALSTVHKAKGLECQSVVVLPCDAKHYPDSPAARRRLYVAISRGQTSLTLVVSRTDPSPLLKF